MRLLHGLASEQPGKGAWKIYKPSVDKLPSTLPSPERVQLRVNSYLSETVTSVKPQAKGSSCNHYKDSGLL